MSQNIGVLE